MRRFVHGLLAALVIFGTVSAKTYTNKTFLMPRSHNPNLAMEYTTWHTQTALIDEDKFGGTVQATLFYDKSNNKDDLGKYFGVCNWGHGNCIEDFVTVVPEGGTTLAANQPKHLSAAYTFHSPYAGSTIANGRRLADKVCWKPYRESYGVRLDYHQNLDKILKGLFFKVSMPIVHVKTSMGYTSSCVKDCGTCSTDCSTGCTTACEATCGCPCDAAKCCDGYCIKEKLSQAGDDGTPPAGADVAGAPTTGDEKSFINYLTGNVSNDVVFAKQAALCKAKIHCGQSETGIADIDLMLGYNFLYKPTRHVNVSIGLTIPTGNTPDGEWLFEPMVGNAGHWAFGAGLDSKFQLWKDEDKSLDFLFAFNYRYLFSDTERRTIGFKWTHDDGTVGGTGNLALYGHYILGGKKGSTTTTPMANFLTHKLKVTPGSQFDGIASLAFHYANWTFDLGYNLFYKEKEDVCAKCCPCPTDCTDTCNTSCDPCGTTCETITCWEDDTYGIPWNDWYTSSELTVGGSNNGVLGSVWINKTDLCYDVATNDSVTTHKIFGGAGYVFKEWDYPLLLGLGGSYEFVSDNNALEVWSLWAKIGLTF